MVKQLGIFTLQITLVFGEKRSDLLSWLPDWFTNEGVDLTSLTEPLLLKRVIRGLRIDYIEESFPYQGLNFTNPQGAYSSMGRVIVDYIARGIVGVTGQIIDPIDYPDRLPIAHSSEAREAWFRAGQRDLITNVAFSRWYRCVISYPKNPYGTLDE